MKTSQKLFITLIVLGLLSIMSLPVALAANVCTFTTVGSTMKLNSNCTTDVSIIVPDGFTLDGQGRTITAVDPAGGHFVGGIVQSGGAVANVTNVRIRTVGLADVCDDGVNRLRGILFTGAKGSITNNTIVALNQGASGCQEGNGIEVRNFGDAPGVVSVLIASNTVQNWQKTGILANGDVNVYAHHNSVGESATQANLAANSIQLGFGAVGRLINNTVHGSTWCCVDAAATGILLYDVGSGVIVRGNDVWGNADIGIYIFGNGVLVEKNRLAETGPDGYYDTGIYNEGTGNTVQNNRIKGYDTPYETYTTFTLMSINGQGHASPAS